jgi:hypothetical protein
VLSRGVREGRGCATHVCDIKLDGQFGCNGTATFSGGACYERGAGNVTQPAVGCDGIDVYYRVDGRHGAGSGVVVVSKKGPEINEDSFVVSNCGPYPLHPPLPMGQPCLGVSGNCTVEG